MFIVRLDGDYYDCRRVILNSLPYEITSTQNGVAAEEICAGTIKTHADVVTRLMWEPPEWFMTLINFSL